jgi:N-acetylmuramoyl-L-alanine amidase
VSLSLFLLVINLRLLEYFLEKAKEPVMPRIVVWLSRKTIKQTFGGILFLVLVFLAVMNLTPRIQPAAKVLPLAGYVIALDPGHGGYDPGADAQGVLEKDVVLDISFWLRDMFWQAGAQVMMTREKDQSLLELPAGPKKQQDLENRLKLIEEADVDILISIHANAIASPRWFGAQTFYKSEDEESQRLAGLIQEEIIRVMRNTTRKITAGRGNYFLLENSPVPGVIVEVGFLSNPRERGLLAEPTYQKKMAWCIYLGTIRYFNQ